jgi:hypothetical protein
MESDRFRSSIDLSMNCCKLCTLVTVIFLYRGCYNSSVVVHCKLNEFTKLSLAKTFGKTTLSGTLNL